MENHPRKNLEVVQSANKDMLDYFNNTFINDLERIQELKTQVFEIDIKINELERTKDIYAFKSNSRKSVFTPIATEDTDNERSKIIDNQIEDLKGVKESLQSKIRTSEINLRSVKKRIALLNQAEDAIKNISASIPEKETSENTEGFEFIQEEKNSESQSHGYNILMQDAFDNTFLSTIINRNVKDSVTSVSHKLEMLNYLVSTDISRAKLTIKEIINSTSSIIDAIDDINYKLTGNIDSSCPIITQLDSFVMKQREEHPEFIINADIQCSDYELSLHPVFTINIIKLLNIFFENIFKHSNGNSIDFRLSLSPNVIDVSISDNGVGIDSAYLSKTPWYSSLHKAHEIIYLLNGDMNICGDAVTGTNVRFNFPVQPH